MISPAPTPRPFTPCARCGRECLLVCKFPGPYFGKPLCSACWLWTKGARPVPPLEVSP